jgi:hypothetical protein
MLRYEVLVGTRLDRAVAEMLEMASCGEAIQTEFNDIPITVRPGEAAADVVARWEAELERRADEYRRSPEGIAAAERRQRDVAERQWRVNGLVAELRTTLDFSDSAALIRWLDRLTEAADHVDVKVPRIEILAAFVNHGYLANVNTGDAYDPADRENTARYLIGQGMDGIGRMGVPHPIFRKFAADWLAAQVAPR